MTKRPIQVWLDEQDRRLLEGLAQRHGQSAAETVRMAIRRWAVDAAGEADEILGLIGSIEDAELPSDLSTRHDEYAVYGHPAAARVAERRTEP
jgi:hypothetical protein